MKLYFTACLGGFFLLLSSWAYADTVTVAVNQFVEHEALDAARKGLYDSLNKQGYIDGDNLSFKYQTAHANPAMAVQIARQYIGEEPDVIVGIGTTSSQALVSATSSIPIVFTAVSDPLDARLVRNLQQPEKNVTGMSAMSPIKAHIELIQVLLPKAKKIGVVYNTGEVNSVKQVALLKSFAHQYGFSVAEAGVANSSDVLLATKVIAQKVDVIYAPTDNTIASAFEALIIAANATSTPVFGGATFYVDKGAFASLGFNFYQLGEQTAEYVVAILNGTKPSALPVKPAIGTDLVINQKSAALLGIKFSDDIQKRATRIVN